MDLAGKLQVKSGMTLCVQNAPKSFKWDGLTDRDPAKADAVLFFAATSKDLAGASGFLRAATEDRLAWIAYPKAGQMGSDLSRDNLMEKLGTKAIQGVRMVSIDDTWSAMRCRPVTPPAT